MIAAGDGLAHVLAVLTAGFGANTGQDMAGLLFGLKYQDARKSLLQAAAAAIDACRFGGTKIQLSASNYSKAEAASTLGGGRHVLSPPNQPQRFTASDATRASGPGVAAPLLWALVARFVEGQWPNGDATAMHTAATSWRTLGAGLTGMQPGLTRARLSIGARQIVEREKMQQFLSKLLADVALLGEQCGTLADGLDGFADEVARAQNAIRDLLHRLRSVWGEAASVFTGHGLDAISEIVADINAVLHNMCREAQARQQSVDVAMQIIDGWVRGIEKDMRGHLTQFLGKDIGNPVATVADTLLNFEEGVFKGAFELASFPRKLDPFRLLYDRDGVVADAKGIAKSDVIYGLIDPKGAAEADAQRANALLHLDDWRRDRPGLGAGENFFDIVTLLLPGGGETGAAVKGAEAGALGAKGAGNFAEGAGAAGRGGRIAGELAGISGELDRVGAVGRALTKDFKGFDGDLPKADPHPGGRPESLPVPNPVEIPGEPSPRPPESPPPAGPTRPPAGPPGPAASGQPGAPVGPHAPASGPSSASHSPTAPASPAERLPSANLHNWAKMFRLEYRWRAAKHP